MPVAYRDTDPDTSRAAAQATSEEIKGAIRLWIYNLLSVRPCTDEEMWTAYRVARNGAVHRMPPITDARLRHCRKDLERAGRIEPTGEKRVNRSGAKARVWGVA